VHNLTSLLSAHTSPPVPLPSNSSQQQTASAEKSGNFRFFIVDHPDKLKDKDEVQKNRRHVMHDYLIKESKKPSSSDPRAGHGRVTKRKRTNDRATAGTSENHAAPSVLFSHARMTPESSIQSDASSNGSGERRHRIARREKPTGPDCEPATTRPSSTSQLVRSEDDAWLSIRNIEHLGTSAYLSRSPETVPFPLTHFGGDLNPFDTWPKFDDPAVNLNQLKWSCEYQRPVVSDSILTLTTLQAKVASAVRACPVFGHRSFFVDDIPS